MSLQLKNLQWLPVFFRIKAKVLLVALSSVQSGPHYFSDLIFYDSPLPHCTLAILAFLLPQTNRHVTASGSLHWLFPLPRMLCSFRFPSASVPLLGSPLKWHFPIEAFTNSFKGYKIFQFVKTQQVVDLGYLHFSVVTLYFNIFFFYYKLFGTLYPPSLFFFLALT